MNYYYYTSSIKIIAFLVKYSYIIRHKNVNQVFVHFRKRMQNAL